MGGAGPVRWQDRPHLTITRERAAGGGLLTEAKIKALFDALEPRGEADKQGLFRNALDALGDRLVRLAYDADELKSGQKTKPAKLAEDADDAAKAEAKAATAAVRAAIAANEAANKQARAWAAAIREIRALLRDYPKGTGNPLPRPSLAFEVDLRELERWCGREIDRTAPPGTNARHPVREAAYRALGDLYGQVTDVDLDADAPPDGLKRLAHAYGSAARERLAGATFEGGLEERRRVLAQWDRGFSGTWKAERQALERWWDDNRKQLPGLFAGEITLLLV